MSPSTERAKERTNICMTEWKVKFFSDLQSVKPALRHIVGVCFLWADVYKWNLLQFLLGDLAVIAQWMCREINEDGTKMLWYSSTCRMRDPRISFWSTDQLFLFEFLNTNDLPVLMVISAAIPVTRSYEEAQTSDTLSLYDRLIRDITRSIRDILKHNHLFSAL